MKPWLLFALTTLLLWGLWAVFSKLATAFIRPESALFFEVLGILTVGLAVFALSGFRPQVHASGPLYAYLSGVAGTLGLLTFLLALARQKASTVVAVTALYPVVAIALSFVILKESVRLTEAVGILLALAAVFFLTL